MNKDEMCQAAADTARAETLKLCRKKTVNLTPERTLKRISEALDAHEVKASYDKTMGIWVYSKPLIDHGKRLEAAALACAIHGLKQPEKHDVKVDANITVNVIDRFTFDEAES